MDIRKFGSDTDLVSLWDGTVVYNESVLFLEDADGSVPDAPLLYHPDEILQVCSSTCNVEYREGVDFAVVDGKLRRLPRISRYRRRVAEPRGQPRQNRSHTGRLFRRIN